MEEETLEIGTTTTSELLALLLGEKLSAPDLLDRAGGLEALGRADPFEIAAYIEGRDLDVETSSRPTRRPSRTVLHRARCVAAAFELGRRVELARARPPDRFTSAEAVVRWAGPRMKPLVHEELWLVALDGRGHLRGFRCVARGGLHGASIRAADAIRVALRLDASAFVLIHNHPSGDPTPSREDICMTAHVANAARATGIVLLDHIVVARDGYRCVPLPDPSAPLSDPIFRERLTQSGADGTAR